MVVAQATQAQDERRRSSFAIGRVVLQGSRFIDFVWKIHFGYQNAKIKLWMCKWTPLKAKFVAVLGEFLVWCCSQCCLSTPDELVPQIALVSQSNAENRHKNTIFKKLHNSTSHLAFTVIARQFWSEKIRKTFSCRRSSPALGFWRGHGQTDGDRRLLARDRWFELTNESAECNGCIHAKSPAHGKITDSWMFFKFSQTRIAVRPPRRLSGMQKLRGFMNMVFLWLFSALRCDTRAICWTRSSAVTRLPLIPC